MIGIVMGSTSDWDTMQAAARVLEEFGVPIGAIQEVVRLPEITCVPEAPACVEGVINLRGAVVPVVDLRKRFEDLGMAPVGNRPEDFTRAIKEESARWAKVIRARKLAVN